MTAWQSPRSRAADAHLRREAQDTSAYTIRVYHLEDDTTDGWQGVVSKPGSFGEDIAFTKVFTGADARRTALIAARERRKDLTR